MTWKDLNAEEQLQEIMNNSFATPQIIFKHSTRCSISSMAKNRLDKAEKPTNTEFYYLDLIKFRNISNAIADKFKVFHASPQVLVIKNGSCVYDESHSGITVPDILAHI